MAKTNRAPEGTNRLLAALPRRDYQELAGDLEPVALNHGEALVETGQPTRSVYFPDGGLVSVLVRLGGDKVAEVAVVGREGMVGLPSSWGPTHPPTGPPPRPRCGAAIAGRGIPDRGPE
jgi:hypothetical protein